MISFDGLFDKKIYEKEITAKHEVDKALSYATYENATVLPCKTLTVNGQSKSGGGIVISDGSFLKESTVHNNSHIPYEVDRKDVLFCDEEVVYFGMFIGVWGHCITDCIKRAWFLNDPRFSEVIKGKKIIYVAQEGSLHSDLKGILSKSGIDVEQLVEVKTPTKFRSVIVPDSSFFLDDDKVEHFTKEYRDTINKIKEPFYNSNPNKKLYFSHRNIRGYKNDIGEERLEKYFSEHGFEIVRPEKITLDEELRLLASCSTFAATDGSSSLNSMFLPDDAEVIIIPRSPYLAFHQLGINELYPNQKIYYVDSSLSVLCRGDRRSRGPFFYFVSKELIRHVEGVEQEETPKWLKDNFKDFRKYLKRGLYVTDKMTFAASSPYTELAAYYYNRYLCSRKFRTKAIRLKRRFQVFLSKVRKKIFKS